MSHRTHLARAVSLLGLGALAACASAASSASSTETGATVGSAARDGNPNVLTAADMEAHGALESTLYDAVRRLRPSFLRYHGTSGSSNTAGIVHVSLDGAPLAGLDLLAHLQARQVAEVRYLSAVDAAQRFGTVAESGPVLLVKQR